MVRRRNPTTGRYNSQAKVAFEHFMEAHNVARRYFLEDGLVRDAYLCPRCSMYHVGRRGIGGPKPAKNPYRLPDGARGLYAGRQRLYRLLRRYEAQKHAEVAQW